MRVAEPKDSREAKRSFWERHEHKFYRYGHIYANIYGQVIIDYLPQKPLRRPLKLLLIGYSHVFSLLLIVALPCYFGYNYAALMDTQDRRMQLLLYVSFANTLIKYVTVIVTYVANTFHFSGINARCTLQRARLEQQFAGYQLDNWPRRRFEVFMYLKFWLINFMMLIQVCSILAVAAPPADSAAAQLSRRLRVHYAIYAFVLWNYTENMADYFYYITASVLKYLQMLHLQLQQLLPLLQQLQRQRRGIALLRSCCLSERVELLRQHCEQILALYGQSFRLHQTQLLGLMLATLINNLTNLFTIFSLLATQTLADVSYPVLLSAAYALGFYLDTYVVTLINEHIKQELSNLAQTLREFCNQTAQHLPSLERELEQFSLLLLKQRLPMLCGLLHLDRRLIYVITVTAFSYFITLVQFDLYLRNTPSHPPAVQP
ncbi:Gr10a [Drosophila busckii]|uniref:Gustatory receptor n=1 Tax=Drosophila busckii TaxID=30019 RepID=A0A0M4ENB5_DROBS|nr:gustatory receptor 10a [Drosophila busckii]ALC49434.1 Gr10a [Drosophila busckii]